MTTTKTAACVPTVAADPIASSPLYGYVVACPCGYHEGALSCGQAGRRAMIHRGKYERRVGLR